MLIDAIKLFPFIIMANMCIHTGVFFMSGQFLPEKLSFIYDKLSFYPRVAIASIFLIGIGNLIVAKCFINFSPALVTPMMIGVGIPIQIIMSFYILNIKFNYTLIPATLLVIIGCIWVNQVLSFSEKITQ